MASCTPHKGLFLVGPLHFILGGGRQRPTGGEAVEVFEGISLSFLHFRSEMWERNLLTFWPLHHRVIPWFVLFLAGWQRLKHTS